MLGGLAIAGIFLAIGITFRRKDKKREFQEIVLKGSNKKSILYTPNKNLKPLSRKDIKDSEVLFSNVQIRGDRG